MGDPSAALLKIGMSESKVKETLKNEQLTNTLVGLISSAEEEGPVNQAIGNLLYHLASKTKPQIQERVPLVAKYIAKKDIESMVRLDAALEYLVSTAHGEFSVDGLEKACGVGVVVTKEDIRNAVTQLIEKKKNEILEKRYKFNIGLLLQETRSNLKWADGKDVKNEVDSQILSLLGPKTDEDKAPQKKEPKKPSNQTVKQTKVEEVLTIDEMISKLHLHAPGDNYKTDGYVITQNTKQLLEAHLALTKSQVRTRFPPEPNGILHIGHAKAININFGYASYHKGVCFLRYDDTNPEKEEEKYFTGIKDMVEWLGYKPFKITHSSDYFDQLYEWAVKLIKAGLAYVCHQKQEEMQGFNPPPSPWRERPVEENLKLFEDMRKGKMDEGEATLRMKITLEEGKQDPVAYRIKYVAHHRMGNKWCIYPTYDYTHCLCDSIEHITHSLCTKEFQSRRSSYYWLCNALDIYCPVQWEYGRLNMNYTVVSKRKIAKLIEKGIVKDWDDPRLFTLSALRRRGFPPEAINRFCAKVGVTGAQSVVDPDMLEASVRDVLNVTAPRTMVVLEPLQVEIVEGIDQETLLEIPDFPACPDKSKRKAVITKTIFIEASDFKEQGEKGYKRWTKDQPVGLRYANYLLKYISEGSSSKYRTIKAKAEVITAENKPKAFIHWVSKPVPVEVRLYNNLFKHKNPEDTNEVPNGFLSDVTSDSLVVCEGLADASITKASRPFTQFQFERLGYFSIDPDTRPSKMVFNRTVLLKEDSGKS